MPQQSDSFFERFLEKLSGSRDFTISFVLHLIVVVIFGTTVLFQAVEEPPDFEGATGGFVEQSTTVTPARPQQTQAATQPDSQSFNVASVAAPVAPRLTAITTSSPTALNFNIAPSFQAVRPDTTSSKKLGASVTASQGVSTSGLTKAAAQQIKAFTGGWGKGTGGGTGIRKREFEFTAYLGKYEGGNWNSTVRVSQGKIETGSLPNLLYLMSFWSSDKIKTNYRNVEALDLASEEIFAVKPPFIFMTGSQDFVLSDKEVENLRRYLRMGGCVWGDSSVPGRGSRFDTAFRREMRRVIADKDKDFYPLPDNHPIFTAGYFPEVREVPPGVNFYRDPVEALDIYGEVAVIYTSNDYGDMFSIGLTKDGKIDRGKDEKNRYVAISNPELVSNRFVYIRNITEKSLAQAYRFGTNMVVFLLTRWENRLQGTPGL